VTVNVHRPLALVTVLVLPATALHWAIGAVTFVCAVT